MNNNKDLEKGSFAIRTSITRNESHNSPQISLSPQLQRVNSGLLTTATSSTLPTFGSFRAQVATMSATKMGIISPSVSLNNPPEFIDNNDNASTPERRLSGDEQQLPPSDSDPVSIINNNNNNNTVISSWTEQVIAKYLQLADICKNDSRTLRRMYFGCKVSSDVINFLIILSGLATVFSGFSLIAEDSQRIISIVSGASTSLLTSLNRYFEFAEKAGICFTACEELDRTVREINIELIKPENARQEPYSYLMKIENKRWKIMQSVNKYKQAGI
jgi:hypothetical protein